MAESGKAAIEVLLGELSRRGTEAMPSVRSAIEPTGSSPTSTARYAARLVLVEGGFVIRRGLGQALRIVAWRSAHGLQLAGNSGPGITPADGLARAVRPGRAVIGCQDRAATAAISASARRP